MKIGAEHIYKGYHNAAGKRVPGVTTIAKLIDRPEGLIHWAWQCGIDGKDYRKARDEAATIGHIAHAMIEAHIKEQDFTLAPDVDAETRAGAEKSFSAFLEWKEMSRFSLVRTEVRVLSEQYQFGGRLDCVASVMGKLCIVDWKTAKSVYPGYLLQVAAYRNAYNAENRNAKITGSHLLRVKKDDGGFVHHYFPEETLDKAWQAFLVCRELYDLSKEVAKAI